MTSRERLLTVLDGGVPDRVPISTYELVGYNSRAFENNDPSYRRLMDAIRERTDCVCMWNPQGNGTFLDSAAPVELRVEEERAGNTVTIHKRLQTPKGELTDTAKRMDNLHTVWHVERWCKSPADVDKALSISYTPISYDFSDLGRIKAEVGNHGIIMSSLADPLCVAAELMEFGQYTVWAFTETEHFLRTLDALHERIMANLERMLDHAVVDLYRICGPEYATPPYLPPPLFERFVVPYVSEMAAFIQSKGGKARFHCHGQIGQVTRYIEATGADAIDPCEPPPDGDIELSEVKRRLGGTMCIFGNLELKLLEWGSTEEVEQTIKNCMDAAKRGGGYVIMPTAGPINSPLAEKTESNYLTFIEAANRWGVY